MTPEAADAFLRVTRIAKLATLKSDGSPTVVPVWFEWDGEVARVFTLPDSPKVRRLRRDPRVALSVEEGVGAREAWVTIEGIASLAQEGGLALARRLIERYYDEARIAETWPSWEPSAAEWVVITIAPSRIRSS